MHWNTIYLIPSLVNPLDLRHPPHHLQVAFIVPIWRIVCPGQAEIAEELLEFPQNLFKSLAITGCMRKHCWDNFFPEDNCESFRQDSCVHLPQKGDSHLSSPLWYLPNHTPNFRKNPFISFHNRLPFHCLLIRKMFNDSSRFNFKHQLKIMDTSQSYL